MDLLTYSAKKNAEFRAFLAENGKEGITTFYQDFTIAEITGRGPAIRDTYKRAFKAWRDNVRYFAELVCCLNLKIWEHTNKNRDLAEIYNELWEEADAWGLENFKGEELAFFIDFLD